jgi:hypothetical protein
VRAFKRVILAHSMIRWYLQVATSLYIVFTSFLSHFHSSGFEPVFPTLHTPQNPPEAKGQMAVYTWKSHSLQYWPPELTFLTSSWALLLMCILEPHSENLFPELAFPNASVLTVCPPSPNLELLSSVILIFIVRQWPNSVFPFLEIPLGFVLCFQICREQAKRYIKNVHLNSPL